MPAITQSQIQGQGQDGREKNVAPVAVAADELKKKSDPVAKATKPKESFSRATKLLFLLLCVVIFNGALHHALRPHPPGWQSANGVHMRECAQDGRPHPPPTRNPIEAIKYLVRP